MNKKLLILGLPVLFAACDNADDKVDTQKPTIEIITPEEHQEIPLGEKMKIEAHLVDDKGLASYKIEIHSAEDGHHHKNAAEPFTFNEEGTISSVAAVVEKEATIPTGIQEGHYHLGIFAIDKAGNQSEVFRTIVLGEDHDDDHNH